MISMILSLSILLLSKTFPLLKLLHSLSKTHTLFYQVFHIKSNTNNHKTFNVEIQWWSITGPTTATAVLPTTESHQDGRVPSMTALLRHHPRKTLRQQHQIRPQSSFLTQWQHNLLSRHHHRLTISSLPLWGHHQHHPTALQPQHQRLPMCLHRPPHLHRPIAPLHPLHPLHSANPHPLPAFPNSSPTLSRRSTLSLQAPVPFLTREPGTRTAPSLSRNIRLLRTCPCGSSSKSSGLATIRRGKWALWRFMRWAMGAGQKAVGSD